MTYGDMDIILRSMGGSGHASGSISLDAPPWGRPFTCAECMRRGYPNGPGTVALVDYDPMSGRLKYAVKVRRRHQWHSRLVDQDGTVLDPEHKVRRSVWVKQGADGSTFDTKCNNGHTVTVGPDIVIAAFMFAAREGIDGPIPLAAA